LSVQPDAKAVQQAEAAILAMQGGIETEVVAQPEAGWCVV
jgi:hypothetical protein